MSKNVHDEHHVEDDKEEHLFGVKVVVVPFGWREKKKKGGCRWELKAFNLKSCQNKSKDFLKNKHQTHDPEVI